MWYVHTCTIPFDTPASNSEGTLIELPFTSIPIMSGSSNDAFSYLRAFKTMRQR